MDLSVRTKPVEDNGMRYSDFRKIKDVAVRIKCDITKLTEQDYQDINEFYLKNLIIVFENPIF